MSPRQYLANVLLFPKPNSRDAQPTGASLSLNTPTANTDLARHEYQDKISSQSNGENALCEQRFGISQTTI